MRAVVYREQGRFEVEEIPTPSPDRTEVLVRVLQGGVCGTDLHIDAGEYEATYPLTPGHEVVGTVEALGEDVNGFAVGEQVVVNPNRACGTCGPCRRGRRLLCERLTAVGVTRAGGFAEFLVAPVDLVHSAEGLTPDVAVLTEPLSCATHGLETLSPRPGSRALVFGVGPTGVLLAQLLVHGGAGHVTVADTSAAKLERAAGYGIDATVLVDRDDPDASSRELTALAPDGFDVVVEATGVPAVAQRCLGLVAAGGTLLIYGVEPPEATVAFHPYDVFRREITIKGSFAEIDTFPAALATLRSGRVRTDGLITHRYALEEYGEALAALRRGDPEVHKVLVHP